MLTALHHFHQSAVQHKLSSSAILLWQTLYFAMTEQKQFSNFRQDTAELTTTLGISRQGLLLARKRLQQVGLLAVQLDENHKLCYTLQLDGKPLQPTEAVAAPEALPKDPASSSAADTAHGNTGRKASNAQSAIADGQTVQRMQTMTKPVVTATSPAPAADVVMNHGYSSYLKNFCNKYDNLHLWTELCSWMKLRVQNGWTLTAWGLEELLHKLQQLAGQDVEQMLEIVRQSIRRRWKGFHALKVQSRPCGEKLLRLEEKERRAEERWAQRQPNRGQNFRSGASHRDLDVLAL